MAYIRGKFRGILIALAVVLGVAGLIAWDWTDVGTPAEPRVLLPVIVDGHWGLIDTDGRTVLEPTATSIRLIPAEHNPGPSRRDDPWSLYSTEGTLPLFGDERLEWGDGVFVDKDRFERDVGATETRWVLATQPVKQWEYTRDFPFVRRRSVIQTTLFDSAGVVHLADIEDFRCHGSGTIIRHGERYLIPAETLVDIEADLNFPADLLYRQLSWANLYSGVYDFFLRRVADDAYWHINMTDGYGEKWRKQLDRLPLEPEIAAAIIATDSGFGDDFLEDPVIFEPDDFLEDPVIFEPFDPTSAKYVESPSDVSIFTVREHPELTREVLDVYDYVGDGWLTMLSAKWELLVYNSQDKRLFTLFESGPDLAIFIKNQRRSVVFEHRQPIKTWADRDRLAVSTDNRLRVIDRSGTILWDVEIADLLDVQLIPNRQDRLMLFTRDYGILMGPDGELHRFADHWDWRADEKRNRYTDDKRWYGDGERYLAAVRNDAGAFGLVDLDGKWLMQPVYRDIRPADIGSYGCFWYVEKMEGSWQVVDSTGRLVTTHPDPFVDFAATSPTTGYLITGVKDGVHCVRQLDGQELTTSKWRSINTATPAFVVMNDNAGQSDMPILMMAYWDSYSILSADGRVIADRLSLVQQVTPDLWYVLRLRGTRYDHTESIGYLRADGTWLWPMTE